MKKNAIITTENAREWATVYEMVEKINQLKSIDDFSSSEVYPTYGIYEIYCRLKGWRRHAYRSFLMSGYLTVQRWFGKEAPKWIPNPWEEGNIKDSRTIEVTVQVFPKGATDFNCYNEHVEKWSWERLCKLYQL